MAIKSYADNAPLYCQHPGWTAPPALPLISHCQTGPDKPHLISGNNIKNFPGGSSIPMQIEFHRTSSTSAHTCPDVLLEKNYPKLVKRPSEHNTAFQRHAAVWCNKPPQRLFIYGNVPFMALVSIMS